MSVALFPGRPRPPSQSNKERQLPASVTATRLGTINPIPIDYGCRPRLREPAHPARINLAQEPLDFRREGLSPSLPLLMSAFSLPIPPACLTARLHRPTERSATAPEDRNQGSGIGALIAPTRPRAETLQHLGDLLIFISPMTPRRLLDISQIQAISRPHPHLVRRAQRHHKKAPELGCGLTLLAEPFSDIRADRFTRPPNLIAKRSLLDPRKDQTFPMNLERYSIRPFEDIQVLERSHRPPFSHLSSDP